MDKLKIIKLDKIFNEKKFKDNEDLINFLNNKNNDGIYRKYTDEKYNKYLFVYFTSYVEKNRGIFKLLKCLGNVYLFNL